MDRVRKTFGRRASNASEYEPLHDPDEATALDGSSVLEGQDEAPFSWMEYSIFAVLGMAMLWAWYVTNRTEPPPSP
jgi:equilibrative nucleoside transporter 1/2/3